MQKKEHSKEFLDRFAFKAHMEDIYFVRQTQEDPNLLDVFVFGVLGVDIPMSTHHAITIYRQRTPWTTSGWCVSSSTSTTRWHPRASRPC